MKSYKGRKVLLLKELNLDGSFSKEDTVAIDFVDADAGDIVLASQEGGATRKLVSDLFTSVKSFIVSVVENWAEGSS